MNNNNYIAWPYIPGIPECIARARAIYSGIPLIAMQYNISVRGDSEHFDISVIS